MIKNLSNKNLKTIDKYKSLILNIINNNTEVNVARSKYTSFKSIIKTICLVIEIISIIIALYFKNNYIFIISILTPIVGLILVSSKKNTKMIYNTIIPSIIKNYNTNMNYDHYKSINSSDYRKADFEDFDSYHSEDLITGSINNIHFQISEIETSIEEKDDEGNDVDTTLFCGTFAVINLSKNFNCTIEIVSEYTDFANRDNHVTIDNEEFEKMFYVFSDDKILTMRLLSPVVTTKMVDLYNETGIYFEIKILNDTMYIRLHTADLFEYSFSTPEKEAEQLAKSIAQLDSIYIIMNCLINEIERMDI